MKCDTIRFVLSQIEESMATADIERQLYLQERKTNLLKNLSIMEPSRIRNQRELIASLQAKKGLSTGQEKLDITARIVNEQIKLNKMMYPKRKLL